MYRVSGVNIHIQLPTVYIHYIYSYIVVIYSCYIIRSTEQNHASFVKVLACLSPSCIHTFNNSTSKMVSAFRDDHRSVQMWCNFKNTYIRY